MAMLINWSFYLFMLSLLSVGLFLLSLLFVPLVVCRLPEDYFLRRDAGVPKTGNSPLFFFSVVFRNIAGYLLVLAGFIMLFTPGQGLLTLFIGALCIDFPGKRALERRLIRNRRLQRTLNWIRRRNQVTALKFP